MTDDLRTDEASAHAQLSRDIRHVRQANQQERSRSEWLRPDGRLSVVAQGRECQASDRVADYRHLTLLIDSPTQSGDSSTKMTATGVQIC